LIGDVKKASIKALKLAAGFLIAELSAEHIQEMTGGRDGLADSGNVGPGSLLGNRDGRNAVRLRGVLAGEVEFALEVRLGHLQIPQSHADVVVAQQLHQSGKTDTETKHLRGESVA